MRGSDRPRSCATCRACSAGSAASRDDGATAVGVSADQVSPTASGRTPLTSSHSTTPSEYTSLRVSTCRASPSACSGLMYSGVPARSSAASPASDAAIAMPKSMIFGAGRPSSVSTSRLPGFRSRWTTPLWCACCTPSQTRMNNATRSSSDSRCSRQ